MHTIVWYSLTSDTPVTPQTPLPSLPIIPRGAIVALEGRAPIWRYAMAFHLLHGSSAAAIGTYDPKVGLVIVASHIPLYHEGQVLDIEVGTSELDK